MDDIIDALPTAGNWRFLMMGSGLPEENDAIKKHIHERGLDDKIILTGYIDWHDMAAYWNAIDCAVHVPRTTERWIETFSLSVVQAMATGKPIIGNTSGSVPYQIGDEGIIVPEGDISALHDKLVWVQNNPEQAKIIGERMKSRAINCFGIKHLNDCFYDTILDIQRGHYDPLKADMTKYNVNVE